MDNNVQIPLSVFDNKKFKSMTPGDQIFLIFLYAEFHDTETFTIDMARPELYRLGKGFHVSVKIQRLVKAKLLKIVGKKQSVLSNYNYVRVFSLVHK